jgi:phosphatidylserine decarboxylase
VLLHLRWPGPNEIPCSTRVTRGQELGWFEHGSTIIMFAPKGFGLCKSLQSGDRIRMGEKLMEIPPS